MSKSNYEVYAEKNQPQVLKTTRTFAEAINLLNARKGFMSTLCCRAACEVITVLYGLPYNQYDKVDKLYEQKEQVEAYEKDVALEEAIKVLKEKKVHMSDLGYEAACEYIAQLYGRCFDELVRAIDGYEYWIV